MGNLWKLRIWDRDAAIMSCECESRPKDRNRGPG